MCVKTLHTSGSYEVNTCVVFIKMDLSRMGQVCVYNLNSPLLASLVLLSEKKYFLCFPDYSPTSTCSRDTRKRNKTSKFKE